MKIIQKSATLPCPERDDHVLQLLPPLLWLHTVLLHGAPTSCSLLGDPAVGQDVQGEGVLRRGLRLTCPAGEVHTPIASGIQHKREAAEAVVGAVRVQTLAIDAIHFVLTLILVYPYTRTEQCFRLADMSNVTLSLPKWGPQGLLPPPLIPREGPRKPVVQTWRCSLGSSDNSGCSSTSVPLCAVGCLLHFETILPTHSSLLES